jgi:DNA polymerase
MTPSRFMVIGQNPGYDEMMIGLPFVGAAGRAFDQEIAKHGLSRKDFYISNIVKCYTEHNRGPTAEEIVACSEHLSREIEVLKPTLVITLGLYSFKYLCSDAEYNKSLGTIVKSTRYDVKVFPIYHPSPRNLSVQTRRRKYEHDIEMLCKVINYLNHGEGPPARS